MIDLNKVTLGSWITLGHTSIGELMSSFEFDWLCVDMEHSTISFEQLSNLIIAIEKNNCTPIVRVGKNEELEIKKTLDAGAKGIIVPQICSKLDAEKAVKYSRYQPVGERGVGLSRAQGFGFNFENYKNNTEKEIFIIALIEHKDAIKNIDEILEVEGINGSIIGPYDLSASFGKPGKLNDEEVINALKIYEKKIINSNKPIGIHAVNNSSNEINEKINLGYKFIGLSLDTILLGNACKNILEKINR